MRLKPREPYLTPFITTLDCYSHPVPISNFGSLNGMNFGMEPTFFPHKLRPAGEGGGGGLKSLTYIMREKIPLRMGLPSKFGIAPTPTEIRGCWRPHSLD